MPATIDDPAILPEIAEALTVLGYTKEGGGVGGAAILGQFVPNTFPNVWISVLITDCRLALPPTGRA